MRRLRALVLVPMVGMLLLASVGAASASPATQDVNSHIPFFRVGFPCYAPHIEDIGIPGNIVTDESLVFLWTSGDGEWLGRHDFSKMKCFFHYEEGTVIGAPYTEHNFPCTYSNDQIGTHVFAHSVFIVRDTWALMICTGTANKLDQTITFTSSPAQGNVGGSRTVTATATSGLPVSFSIDPSATGVCSIVGALVSFNAVGTCVINANQAGDSLYNAAPQVQQSIVLVCNNLTPNSVVKSSRRVEVTQFCIQS